ncbi:MAG: TIGR02147 family protein, partial [Bdellovibrionales bacterium]|nr:TIGR02147 family protein [Bdellovibrionales bacterium]
LRSFAAYLGVSPATLSQIISGKRGVSFKRLNMIMEKLGLTPKEQSRALRAIKRKKQENQKTTVLREDQFRLISDWHHYAILSLGELDDNQADPRWIAQRLNIKVDEANEAIARLQRMGIIQISEGRFRQVADPLNTTSDIPSSSIRRYHKGILGLAQNRIDHIPVDRRHFTSITMAVNTSNLEEAKRITQEYKDDMANLLEEGSLDDVYQLSIQLFPLTVKESK